jgi:hypothetical protein
MVYEAIGNAGPEYVKLSEPFAAELKSPLLAYVGLVPVVTLNWAMAVPANAASAKTMADVFFMSCLSRRRSSSPRRLLYGNISLTNNTTNLLFASLASLAAFLPLARCTSRKCGG